MSRPGYDETRYLPIRGERGFVVPLVAGTCIGFGALSVVILVLSAGSETFGGVVAALVIVNLVMLGVLVRVILSRRAYLRGVRNGRIIDRTPGRATGVFWPEKGNLGE